MTIGLSTRTSTSTDATGGKPEAIVTTSSFGPIPQKNIPDDACTPVKFDKTTSAPHVTESSVHNSLTQSLKESTMEREPKLDSMDHKVQPCSKAKDASIKNSVSSSKYKTNKVRRCLAHWPRTLAFLGKLFLLWILILWALCFGYILSELEGPPEIVTNNKIMQQRWFFQALPLQEVFVAIVNMPTACMEKFIQENVLRKILLVPAIPDRNDTNATVPIQQFLLGRTDIDNTTLALVEDILGDRYPNLVIPEVPQLSNPDATTNVEDLLEALYVYLETCEDIARELVQHGLELVRETSVDRFGITLDNLDLTNPLTFNWIRCWDFATLGSPNPWSPSPQQINASANQDVFFRQQWSQDQQQLFQEYTEQRQCVEIQMDNSTNDHCVVNATIDSVLAADGGKECETNTGASAWFWFTVMTTVGYGNQSPVTTGGRALVSALGWFSIIAFGGITVYSSSNWTAMVDDLFRRTRLTWLTRPFYAAILWGVMSIAWIVFIAMSALRFWANRVPGYDVSVADSLWFAYISLLTVGLGDFYLQPQGLFVADIFSWASRMLTGFVLVGTFLGKVGELISSFLPTQNETFAEYLQRTDGCTGDIVELPQSRTLRILKEVEEEDEDMKHGNLRFRGAALYESFKLASDGKTFESHEVAILVEKRKLLIKMLHDTQTEMDERLVKSGGTSLYDQLQFSELQHEEQILETNLQRTQELRSELETKQMEQGR